MGPDPEHRDPRHCGREGPLSRRRIRACAIGRPSRGFRRSNLPVSGDGSRPHTGRRRLTTASPSGRPAPCNGPRPDGQDADGPGGARGWNRLTRRRERSGRIRSPRCGQLDLRERPVAIRLAKETIDRAFDLGWKAGLEYERRAFAITLSGDEAAEGIAAFLEKRPPRWDS